MMDVLFSDVRIVPKHFLLESPRRSVMLDLADVCANDALEGMKHRTRPNSFYWISPLRSLAEVHRVVIPVSEPEPNRHASGGFDSQGIDELFTHKPHGRRAENDDTLLVQPNDSLMWAEIEQLCKVQLLAIRCVVATWLRLHNAPFYAQEVQTTWLRNPIKSCSAAERYEALERCSVSTTRSGHIDDIARAVDSAFRDGIRGSAWGFQTHRRT